MSSNTKYSGSLNHVMVTNPASNVKMAHDNFSDYAMQEAEKIIPVDYGNLLAETYSVSKGSLTTEYVQDVVDDKKNVKYAANAWVVAVNGEKQWWLKVFENPKTEQEGYDIATREVFGK